MDPPPAPENGKSTLSFTLPNTPVTMALFTNGNKRKAMSSEPELLPPPKELKSGAEDTLFQGDRELWLANKLMNPEIYLTLQASKDSPASPSARYKTKAAAHRHIAFEFNREKEHAGFVVDEGKIKNKIAKMCQHFKLAHRFRYSSGFGRTDDMTWRNAVKERYAYYFLLEPVWASVWSDGITISADSPTNLVATSSATEIRINLVQLAVSSSILMGEARLRGVMWIQDPGLNKDRQMSLRLRRMLMLILGM
ncbi:hypothetical protein BKA57DRAFT_469304 [Linnemannia elongata]|nr:hypothetical protein BKA57DRAFT_469304 [Linnemannia elongata]